MSEIMDFGRKVKYIMKQRGITQSWLAQKIGITEATLSRYVNNSRKPQADIAADIAEVLDISLDYLMGISGCPSPIKTMSTEETLLISAFSKASPRDRKIIFGVLEDHMTSEELETFRKIKFL
ncbi:MAG: helix-turn-helix transcriptional regulator [Oscillospiraceae bacterium]|nr:helix-turn-helix transcriptional regulator [Oscillospiraceae bacterium]